MSDQLYQDFMARVPLGTRVMGDSDLEFLRPDGRLFIKGLEGMVMRHGFEFERSGKKGTTWINVPVVMFFDNPHEWDVRPADLLYWIDGKWITVDELLAK